MKFPKDKNTITHKMCFDFIYTFEAYDNLALCVSIVNDYYNKNKDGNLTKTHKII